MIRDNVMESLSGVKGENSIKIFGPELETLEELGKKAVQELSTIQGVENPGVFRIKGQSNLEFGADRIRCGDWGVNAADVLSVIETAIGGKTCSQMMEGEKSFAITLRFPEKWRGDEEAIGKIPVDIVNNTVTSGPASVAGTLLTGAIGPGIAPTGSAMPMPSLFGTLVHLNLRNLAQAPQRRLKDLIVPLDADGSANPNGQYVRPGASTISRDNGKRFIAVRFGVRGRDLASTVAAAQVKVNPLITPPYSVEWSGEFQEMEEA